MVNNRFEDWPRRLSDYLSAMKDVPFEWGVNDCILFAAKGYESMTGIDYYSQYLPYSNEAEAKAILESNGGFEGIIGANIGPGHRNILKAKRGDPVLLKIPNFTCGLVDDSGQFIAVPSEKGIVKYPLSKAWRIWS